SSGVVCGGGEQVIIHGWARNAPSMRLPDDVGFSVGKNTPYKYIVLNIHYLTILQNDKSGNQLLMSKKKPNLQMGILLGATSQIYLKPKSHTRVNSMYRVRFGEITQIVKSDPQWAQSFYQLPLPVEVVQGDYIIGQCVYDNDGERTIVTGGTHHDEMCNVYAMFAYHSDSQKKPLNSCWENQFAGLINLIPTDADVPPRTPLEISGNLYNHAEHTMDNHLQLTNDWALTSNGDNLYKCIETWPDSKSTPGVGEIGGIALDLNDDLVIFHRGQRKWENKYFNDDFHFRNDAFGPIEEDVLIHIDTKTGMITQKWGAKTFYMPHGITIDDRGNFWLTDIAMHQVFMYSLKDKNRPSLIVGQKFQPGSGRARLCRPADVAVMKNEEFYVADGYCNSRIVKFNKYGEYITEWGTVVNGVHDVDGFPLPNQWNIVHSLALNEEQKLLCGADRENYRIQCFDLQGQFQRQIHVEQKNTIAPIYAIEFTPTANSTVLYAVTGGQAQIKKVYLINARDGKILTSFEPNSHLVSPHDITVSANGSIHRLNTAIIGIKNTSRRSGGSFMGNWMHHRKGFERLNQYSDDENEPVDQNSDGNEDSENATPSNGKETITESDVTQNNTSLNNIAFKMDNNLY
ncbi:unnamed protein product, partial [Didymodactylos carnosus]